MRLWTIHPKYLDPRGLVALWREALLAQKVLRGLTVGYTNHPQLIRFRNQAAPVNFLAEYLSGVYDESVRRGYRFEKSKIGRRRTSRKMTETTGQLLYEWEHLQRKLAARSPAWKERWAAVTMPEPHPLFCIVAGGVQEWERRLGREIT